MNARREPHHFQAVRWAGLTFLLGGLGMVVLWLVFTYVHGPTSFNQDKLVLGRSMLFWGRMLGSLPNLLLAVGLMTLHTHFVKGGSRLVWVGYTLTLIGLIVPAAIDLLVWKALGPPFFVPVVGIGLILLAAGNRQLARVQWQSVGLLTLIGVCQLIAFAVGLVPLEVSDQFGGYRIYGLFAYFVTGIGYMILGVCYWQAALATESV